MTKAASPAKEIRWRIGPESTIFKAMSAAEVLRLPLRERLQIMEAIWEDLRTRAESFDISQNEKDLLDARRARVAAGETQILDWDQVKHSIGRA